jgi:hypothetical protein
LTTPHGSPTPGHIGTFLGRRRSSGYGHGDGRRSVSLFTLFESYTALLRNDPVSKGIGHENKKECLLAQNPNALTPGRDPLHDPPEPPAHDPPTKPLHDPPGDPTYEPPQPHGPNSKSGK